MAVRARKVSPPFDLAVVLAQRLIERDADPVTRGKVDFSNKGNCATTRLSGVVRGLCAHADLNRSGGVRAVLRVRGAIGFGKELRIILAEFSERVLAAIILLVGELELLDLRDVAELANHGRRRHIHEQSHEILKRIAV
eukprot:Amastigsp_a685359_13.p3 type:complete len:139 gc:universal Amastigsp_a685359_13:665-249(-)